MTLETLLPRLRRKDTGGGIGRLLPSLEPKPRPTIEGFLPSLKPKEPGVLMTSVKSFTRALENIAGTTIGGGAQWAGEIIEQATPDADVMNKAGKLLTKGGKHFQQFWQHQQQTGWEAPDPSIWQGSFMQNPSWKRAIGATAGAIPSLAAAYGTFMATKNPWASVGIISAMVAPETYVEAREAGKSVNVSSLWGAARGIGEGILEVLPMYHFLKPAKALKIARRFTGKGFKYVAPGIAQIAKRKARYIFTGAAIEGTEEALQEIWSNTIAKVGYDKTRSLMSGVVESMIAGAMSGGALGGFTQRTGVNLDALAEEANWNQSTWDLVLKDVMGQLKQKSGEVEGVIEKSLGAAAKGFSRKRIVKFEDYSIPRDFLEQITPDMPFADIKKIMDDAKIYFPETVVRGALKKIMPTPKEVTKPVVKPIEKALPPVIKKPKVTKQSLLLRIRGAKSIDALEGIGREVNALVERGALVEKIGKSVQDAINRKRRRLSTPYKNILSKVIEYGGIDPDLAARAGYNIDEDFNQFGLVSILRKGGNSIDGLATELGYSSADALLEDLKGQKGRSEVAIDKETERRDRQEKKDILFSKRQLIKQLRPLHAQDLDKSIAEAKKKIADLPVGVQEALRPLIVRHETRAVQEIGRQEKKKLSETAKKRIEKVRTELTTGELITDAIIRLESAITKTFGLSGFLGTNEQVAAYKNLQMYYIGMIRGSRFWEKIDGYVQGENWEFFYGRTNKSRDKNKTDFYNHLEDFQSFIRDNRIDDRKWFERQQINDHLSLSSDEKVEIFMSMQDKDKRRHLVNVGFKNDEGKIISLSLTDIEVVRASVIKNKQELAMAKYLYEWYELRWEKIAETYRLLTGKELGRVAGYGGMIKVDRDTLDFSEDIANELWERGEKDVEGVDRVGFLKEREEDAIRPLKIGAFDNFLYYLGRSSHYIHMAPTVQDMEKIISSVAYNQGMISKRGQVFYKEARKWVDDISKYKLGYEYDLTSKWFRILRRNVGVSVLGFNLLPGLRQTISTFNAIAEAGSPGAIFSGWAQVTKDYDAVRDFVYKKSPQIKYRFFERDFEEMVRSKGKRAIFGGKTRLSEKSMWLIKKMDNFTMLAVYKGVYDMEIKKHGDEARAKERAFTIAEKTQPQSDVKDLPGFFRGGEIAKTFTMFQNQINNNFNYYTHDIIGKAIAKKLTPQEVAFKVLWSYILPGLMMGIINRGGPPEELNDIAIDMTTYPIAGLYFVGNLINSVLRGYEQWEPLPFQQVGALVRAGRGLQGGDPASAVRYGARALARLAGIPYSQFRRTKEGIKDLIEGNTEDYRRLIWSEWSLNPQKQVRLIPGEGRGRRRRRKRRERRRRR